MNNIFWNTIQNIEMMLKQNLYLQNIIKNILILEQKQGQFWNLHQILIKVIDIFKLSQKILMEVS